MKPQSCQSSGTAQTAAAAMKEESTQDLPRLYLLGPRHFDTLHHYEEELPPWRLKDRMKTVSVALVLCLNLNVDPPDIIKTNPCARLECWFDPLKCHLATKPIKQIGMKLQKQYETWQRRARYKQSHDPTIEELKQLCLSLRRNAKEERVLFHYNGHGVPRPTDNGEIWVFNSNYTQYIPLSVYELQQWLGCPSIYVYDCSNAGVLLKHFNNEGVWKSTQGSEEGDSGTEGEVGTTAAEQHASSASQQRQQPADHLGGAQQQQYLPPADDRGEQQMQHGAGGGGRGGRLSNRQPAADFGPVHPVNPSLVAGNPNFQANNVPGQENLNFNTNLGPNMGRPLESGCSTPQPSVLGESIHLCACGEGELLPMCPDLPADVFTACLTTPITMAVRWFLLQHHCASSAPPLHIADKIPGELHDRRTVLGELNWIFTAITDTIAWNVLPLELFQKLFRQDLLVASLFRNFLLAERVMRCYGCCPVSLPRLPATHSHPMWQSWDLSLQHCLSQLWPNLALTASSGSSSSNTSPQDGLLGRTNGGRSVLALRPSGGTNSKALARNGKDQQYIIHPANLQGLQLPFFQCQLSAFQVWLKLPHRNREPPEQLPVLLQVLLSQVYRPLALELLCSFLSLGRWAVHLVLSVGIFPYILKLLQSTSRDLRPALVTLWAKILAVEQSCKADLIRDSGYQYFLQVLADTSMQAEHRGLAAFVLSVMVSNDPENQRKALQANIIPTCLEHISSTSLPVPYDEVKHSYDYGAYDEHDMQAEAGVRMWPAVCLAATWRNNPEVRWSATRDNAPEKLYPLLLDPVPEVRCACIHALGSFLSSLPVSDQSEQGKTINHSIAVTLVNTCLLYDASPAVRMELAVALQLFVLLYENSFVQLATHMQSDAESLSSSLANQSLNSSLSSSSGRSTSRSFLSLEPSEAMSAMLSPPPARPGSSGAMHRAASVHAISSAGSGTAWWGGTMLSSTGMYGRIWQALLTLTKDPHLPVAALATKVTNFVILKTRHSSTLPRRASGSIGAALDDSFDVRSGSASSVTLGSLPSPGYRGDSILDSGHSTPRRRPSVSPHTSEQFIRPLVNSTLPLWVSQLLVDPVNCPADSPPSSAFFITRSDLLLHQTALPTPHDRPSNPRLMPAALETKLLQELKNTRDATPKRGRPRPKLDNEVLNERLPTLPSVLLFHPSALHLVVCEKSYVSSYNLESSELVNRWHNHPGTSERVTSACVINDACESPLLAVASDDGAVRVWRNPFTHTRRHVSNYATKDPYFKTQWLEAESSTSLSKTSKCVRDGRSSPDWEALKTGWKRRGGNLVVGNSFVGDNIGGFLGEGCRHSESRDKLMGGLFAKGYGWQSSAAPGGLVGSPAAASTPSPSGSNTSSGWGSSPWSGSSTGVASPAAPAANGWLAGGNTFLEPRHLDVSVVRPQVVTAFCATTYVRPGMKGPGPLMSWCQETGQLAVAGGEQRTIRLWDLRTELHAGDLLHTTSSATNYSSCITALHTHGAHIAAGCSDGSVLLLDSRVGLVMPSVGGVSNRSSSGGRSVRERSIVHDCKHDSSWVVCVHLFSDYTVLSGSVSGAVRVVDLRNGASSLLLQSNSEITAMTVNAEHRLFALGTVGQSLSVYTGDGALVNTMQVNDGFLSQRASSPVTAVAFHPTRPLLAAATNDKTVSVYGLQLR